MKNKQEDQGTKNYHNRGIGHAGATIALAWVLIEGMKQGNRGVCFMAGLFLILLAIDV